MISLFFVHLHSFANARNIEKENTKITLSGKIINSRDNTPVSLAEIIIQRVREKAYSDDKGNYSITLPGPGTYIVIVKPVELKPLTEKLEIFKDMRHDFILQYFTIGGRGLTVRGKRNNHILSRYTMKNEDLKEVPGSMGDPVNALSVLAGVERSGGLTGRMIIRSARPGFNKYFIDGMPLPYPLHFNGENAVVATGLIDNIDIYLSAFPVDFSGATASVININTIDSVDQFSGLVNINMMSNSFLLKFPLAAKSSEDKSDKKHNGFIIVGGRYSGLKYILDNLLYKIMHPSSSSKNSSTFISNQRLDYWDYNLKFKYFISSHSYVTLLAIGSGDRQFKKFMDEKDETKNTMFHNQGASFTYFTKKLTNRFSVYSSWNELNSYYKAILNFSDIFLYQMGSPRPLSGKRKFFPYSFGVSDSFRFEWLKKRAELKAGCEYTGYRFNYKGDNDNGYNFVSISQINPTTGYPVSTNVYYPVKITFWNHKIGGYCDNIFTFGGLECTAGFRYDYLSKSKSLTIDPRGSATYTFDTDTSITGGGGIYSSFIQVNPDSLFNEDPNYTKAAYALPERATNAAISLKQEIKLFSFSIEGYHNYFKDIFNYYPHYSRNGHIRLGKNSGRMRTWGFEVMIKKKKSKNARTWFGWLSYSYARAKERSGLFLPAVFFPGLISTNPGQTITALSFYSQDMIDKNNFWWMQNINIYDISGNKWTNASYERRHSLKLVLGYQEHAHTISCRFQLFSSFPYTEVVSSYTLGFLSIPVYNIRKNTAHFPIRHTLDIRYSYKKPYRWGHVKFFIEVVDVYAPLMKSVTAYKPFNSFLPYIPGKNPEGYANYDTEGGLRVLGGIAPSIGAEISF